MVHELAHDIVFDRPVPRWLNEGLAQFAEGMIPGYGPLLIDGRQVRLHRRYWSWFGMDHFWDRRAFLWKPSQRVSYQLSEILYRNLTATGSEAGIWDCSWRQPIGGMRGMPRAGRRLDASWKSW